MDEHSLNVHFDMVHFQVDGRRIAGSEMETGEGDDWDGKECDAGKEKGAQCAHSLPWRVHVVECQRPHITCVQGISWSYI